MTKPVDSCFICLEDFHLLVAGPCQHSMCRECAESWLGQSEECAYCRQPLKTEDLVEVVATGDTPPLEPSGAVTLRVPKAAKPARSPQRSQNALAGLPPVASMGALPWAAATLDTRQRSISPGGVAAVGPSAGGGLRRLTSVPNLNHVRDPTLDNTRRRPTGTPSALHRTGSINSSSPLATHSPSTARSPTSPQQTGASPPRTVPTFDPADHQDGSPRTRVSRHRSPTEVQRPPRRSFSETRQSNGTAAPPARSGHSPTTEAPKEARTTTPSRPATPGSNPPRSTPPHSTPPLAVRSRKEARPSIA